MQKSWKLPAAGVCAGAVNGFFGAGGGTVLVPLLEQADSFTDEELFPAALKIMIPVCAVSLLLSRQALPVRKALPYLAGSLLGGILSGKLKVSSKYLHQAFGALILVGGVRMLWS